MEKTPRRWASRLEKIFLHYGAGSDIVLKATRNRAWNSVAWILIAVGILFWCFMWWALKDIQ